MTDATNRRAVLGAVLAGAAIGATTLPALATPVAPELSAVDRDVIDLWSQRTKLKAIADHLCAEHCTIEDDDFGSRCDDAVNACCDIEVEFTDHIEASVLALGAVLIMEIGHDDHGFERVPRLYRAALSAIRPQLVGAIAEDADRALAEGEDA